MSDSTLRHKILIVDDVEINRTILRNIFQNEYEVLEAGDGIEALELIGRNEADLSFVLLDLVMPRLDGFEVLRVRMDHPLWQDIPVLITTAADETENESKALLLGATDFIRKPFNQGIIRLRAKNFARMRELAIVADKVRTLELISRQNERYRIICEQTGMILAEYNSETGSRFLSDNARNEFGVDVDAYERGDMDQIDFIALLCDEGVIWRGDRDELMAFSSKVRASRPGEMSSISVHMRTRVRGWEWYRLRGATVKGRDGGTSVLFTLDNVNTEVIASRELRYRADHDDLTGAYKRKRFLDVTETLLANHPDISYTIAHWDIDRFKIINELFGERAGDDLLRYIVGQLGAYLDTIGTYARIGDDDFVVCYPTDGPRGIDLVDMLDRDLMNYPLDVGITATFGLYPITDRTLPVSSMCSRASMALDKAKQGTHMHTVSYDSQLHARMLREQEIVTEGALAFEDDEFIVYLQPKVRLDDSSVIGAEALVRWSSPARGLVGPGEFIPIFEHNGLVAPLDEVVWEKTATLLGNWKRSGRKVLPVSVNVSRINFFRPNLVDHFRELVDRCGIEPGLLELEVTESAYIEDTGQITSTVRELQEAGFRVLMDDFGSGYSSLNSLQDMAVDVLKLDLRFLIGMDPGGRGGAIFAAIVDMAHRLDIPVIAEGVETEEQAAFLREVGCEAAQGFLFAKPMPVTEYEAMVYHR